MSQTSEEAFSQIAALSTGKIRMERVQGVYQFRVTDGYGNVLINLGIVHCENGTVKGSCQFPAPAKS